MACPKCNQSACCCSTTVARYTGPDIPELGITTGDLIEVVIQNITNYIIEGVATSTLVNNADGTYTHAPGDESGTSTTFVTGQHTTGVAAHTSPKYGDTWYDTNTSQLKWYTNNGTIDLWESTVLATSLPRFKEETIHHSVISTLTLDPNTHSKREVHLENTGDLLIDGNDHLVSDDYLYLVVNTTAVARAITFSNTTGAWIRDGGAIVELSATGFPIPANSTMLVTVTQSGGSVYVNGHFYALQVAGDTLNTFSSTETLVALTPLVVNVATMVGMESILVLDSTGENITDGILISVSGDNITLTSNVGLVDIEVRVIYST